ncbi:uncharacterized protein LOC119766503 [Culex quinquefasciatus]|uniref:uncharacterized protein LOC119766503 n=1 Tax=Culex quinquefasciatus TaxID=7176 RepID=UPI0018E2B4FE|nr:uncharacterized protein LOC119766503 [Culex quinquefasciatus]
MYAGRGANPSLCIISSASGLDAILERFWQVDDFDRGRALSLDDRWCEDHFNRTVSRRDDGRYVVRLPIREDRRPFLGDSYNLAQRRFLANERRFGYDQQLRDDYLRFMDEYAELGHLEPGLRTGKEEFYLPHHAIRRPDSTTTKTRVVFDASVKGCNQLSLNEILHSGPTVQPTLLSTVLNFRLPKYVFIADIEKMFRQIWIHPEDRKLLKIVWRTNMQSPLETYQLKTVTKCVPSKIFGNDGLGITFIICINVQNGTKALETLRSAKTAGAGWSTSAPQGTYRRAAAEVCLLPIETESSKLENPAQHQMQLPTSQPEL